MLRNTLISTFLLLITLMMFVGCGKTRENTPEGIAISYAQLTANILQSGKISSDDETEIMSYWKDPFFGSGAISAIDEFLEECKSNHKSVVRISDIKIDSVEINGSKAIVKVSDNASVIIGNERKILPSKITYYISLNNNGEWKIGAYAGSLVDIRNFK